MGNSALIVTGFPLVFTQGLSRTQPGILTQLGSGPPPGQLLNFRELIIGSTTCISTSVLKHITSNPLRFFIVNSRLGLAGTSLVDTTNEVRKVLVSPIINGHWKALQPLVAAAERAKFSLVVPHSAFT